MGRESKLRPPPGAVPTGVLTRYQFARELWADQRCVLIDPMLVEFAEALRQTSAAPLVDALVGPGRKRSKSKVTVLAPGPEALTHLAEKPWAFASVDLRPWLEQLPELIPQLAEVVEPGRVLVLHGPASVDLDELFAVLDEGLHPQPGEARIYALSHWRGAAVVDCGEVAGEDDEGEFGITFDNSLGDEVVFEEYLVVFTPGRRFSTEAMTLVELPRVGEAESKSEPVPELKAEPKPEPVLPVKPEVEADKTRHDQLRRQNQLLVSARQHALEQLDEITKRNRDLVRQVEDLQRQVARMASESVTRTEPQLAPAEDLSKAPDDGLRARLQTALWQIEQLEAEVADLRQRPPEELEAELERLRHRQP